MTSETSSDVPVPPGMGTGHRMAKPAEIKGPRLSLIHIYAFQEDVRECLEAGMNAHIAKPIDAAKAERVIAKAMGRRENSVQQ